MTAIRKAIAIATLSFDNDQNMRQKLQEIFQAILLKRYLRALSFDMKISFG